MPVCTHMALEHWGDASEYPHGIRSLRECQWVPTWYQITEGMPMSTHMVSDHWGNANEYPHGIGSPRECQWVPTWYRITEGMPMSTHMVSDHWGNANELVKAPKTHSIPSPPPYLTSRSGHRLKIFMWKLGNLRRANLPVWQQILFEKHHENMPI